MNNIMFCPGCGSGDAEIFFTEKLPCVHCGKTNKVEYYNCTECKTVWKVLGEFIIDSTKFDFADDIDEETVTGVVTTYGGSMEEAIHRCLKCNAIAYEIGPESYHCSKCGFEWEIK